MEPVAYSGLVGAVIGGAIVAISNLSIEAWRAWRDCRRDAASRKRERISAARLVRVELQEALNRWNIVNEYRIWPGLEDTLKTEAWDKFRAVLTGLPAQDWMILAEGFQRIHILESIPREPEPGNLYQAEMPSMLLSMQLAINVASEHAALGVAE